MGQGEVLLQEVDVSTTEHDTIVSVLLLWDICRVIGNQGPCVWQRAIAAVVVFQLQMMQEVVKEFEARIPTRVATGDGTFCEANHGTHPLTCTDIHGDERFVESEDVMEWDLRGPSADVAVFESASSVGVIMANVKWLGEEEGSETVARVPVTVGVN